MELDEIVRLLEQEMIQEYSETVIDHARNPRNVGAMPDADGHAVITGPCGDTMSIWLRVADGRITAASFWTSGCGPSIACGSMATGLAAGKTLTEALMIEQSTILDALAGLPADSAHCALLAANTLKQAVKDYLH